MIVNKLDLNAQPQCAAACTETASLYCAFDSRTPSCNVTSRLFNNVCISTNYPEDIFNDTENDTSNIQQNYIYKYGGMYYSHQIKNPDIELNLISDGDAALDQYLLSFWYFTENNNHRLTGVDTTTSKKHYIFVSDSFNIFVANSSTILEISGSQTTLDITTLFGDLKSMNWFNFLIHTNGVDMVTMNGVYSEKLTLNTTKTISKICFTRSACGFVNTDYWLPGYYQKIELHNNISLQEYKILRSNYDLFDALKYYSPLSYPYTNTLARYYALQGRFVNNLLEEGTDVHALTQFIIWDSVTNSEQYTVAPVYANDINYNDFNYGYSFEKLRIPGTYNDSPSTHSSKTIDIYYCEIGQQNTCQKCLDGYTLTRDNNCVINSINSYVYRSPLLSESSNNHIDIDLPVTILQNKISFSVVLKIAYFNDNSVDIFTIPGVFILRHEKAAKTNNYDSENINGTLKFIILNAANSDEYLFATFNNFSSIYYDRWINIRFVIDAATPNGFYAYYFVDTNKTFIDNANFPDDLIVNFETDTSNINISNDFFGLIYVMNFNFDDGDDKLEYANEGDDSIVYITSGEVIFNPNFDITFYSSEGDSCIDSSIINNLTETNMIACVKDYETVDNYCYLHESNPYGFNSMNIAVNWFDLLAYSKEYLFKMYHFGYNVIEDSFTGLEVHPLSVS